MDQQVVEISAVFGVFLTLLFRGEFCCEVRWPNSMNSLRWFWMAFKGSRKVPLNLLCWIHLTFQKLYELAIVMSRFARHSLIIAPYRRLKR
jgi:hypothetical protein